MLTSQILTQRPDRAVLALAELCRERDDDLYRAPRSESPAPRAMSTSRSGYSTPPINGLPTGGLPGWRSQSQAAPFDRIAASGGGSSLLDAPNSSARRGRHSDADSGPNGGDFTGQDLWLASQGSNLGNLNFGGMGYSESPFGNDNSGGRGRDTSQRGLETPGGYHRAPRRSGSGYDDGHNAGSGSISAPLSPHAMYAKLEMGKSHLHPWPSSSGGGSGNFAPPTSSIPAPLHGRTYKTPTASTNPSRSGSLIPGGPHALALENYHQQHESSTLPPFQPFSPPTVPSILRELNGEPANYISPSTLLSPPTQNRELGVEDVTKGFEGLGVDAPGKGVEAVGVSKKGDKEKAKGKDIEAGLGGGPVGSGAAQEKKRDT